MSTPNDRSAPNSDSGSAPRLMFSTARLDLGDGKPSQILRGELTLTNPNSLPVEYSLIKHCGCMELSPMSGTLRAGGSESVHVGVQLPDHANSEKNTSVEVQTGEPASIVARCVLSARCPAPFHVTPSFINFGSLAQEELAGAAHEVRLESVAGQPPLDAERLLIEHTNDAFQVEQLTENRSDRLSGGMACVRIGLRSEIRAGDQYDTLDLRLSDSDFVMRLPLRVAVVESVSVVPSTVYLRTQNRAKNESDAPIQLLVTARQNGAPLGRISLVNAPPGIEIEDLGDSASGRRRLRLFVRADRNRLSDETQLRLRATGFGREFSFKLSKR